MKYEIISRDEFTRAKRGRITTSHGVIETPVFMPVGTLGTVKAIAPWTLKELGASIILGNTYHLNLRPGSELIRDFKGLHKFMGWDGSILTDSGGFQVFSMQGCIDVSEEGVRFVSHIDGSKHFMSPERCIEIQKNLGTDIMMVLDHLTPPETPAREVREAMDRTLRWAGRCLDAHKKDPQHNALFAIQQGGFDKDMRQHCANQLTTHDFDGFAVGGLSVGEAKDVMYETAAWSIDMLPDSKPRYVMGVGTPEDLLYLVSLGYDMFDCVLPTRNARTGLLYTERGNLVIKNARFREDERPIDENCQCIVCQKYSRAYLRHLFITKEIFGIMLNTHHNLHFYLNLMNNMRKAIEEKRFGQFRISFLEKFKMGIED